MNTINCRAFFLLLGILCATTTFSQARLGDSLKIYFDSGSRKLDDASKKKLGVIIENYKSTIGVKPCTIILGDGSCYTEKKRDGKIAYKRYYEIIDYCVKQGLVAEYFFMQDGRPTTKELSYVCTGQLKSFIGMKIFCNCQDNSRQP